MQAKAGDKKYVRCASIFLLLLTIATSTYSAPPHDVQISSFKQGLMNEDTTGVWKIYEEGNRFPYLVNGRCVANHEDADCMWYGFEFDFTASDDLSVLSCTTQISPPIGLVDPNKKFGDKVSQFNWTMDLKGHKGHIQNPQYSIWPKNPERKHEESSTECIYADKRILKFTFSLIAPVGEFLVPASLRSSQRPF